MPDPPKRPAKGVRRQVTTSRHWAELGPLVPWMLQYLQWLAQEPTGLLSVKGLNRGAASGVTWPQKTARASGIARKKIHMDTIRALEQRPDAVEYFEKLRSDLAYRAREMMSQDIGENVEARREGLAHARQEKDHKAIKGYTDWLPDVAFPKKAAGDDAPARVVIVIGSPAVAKQIGQALGTEEDVTDIEYEVIETKLLTDGEDDG